MQFQKVDGFYIIGPCYFEHSEVQDHFQNKPIIPLIWVSFHQNANFFLSQLLRGTTYILLLALCFSLTLIIFEKKLYKYM